VQAAEDARVLDLHAAVHHRVHAGGARELVGLDVENAELLPQAARLDLDGLLRDRQHVAGAAEHVHHVDGLGDLEQVRVAAFAEDLGTARVHRDDAVPMLLQVLGGEVAGPMPLGRQADDGDGPAVAQDAAQVGDGIGHGGGARFTSP
jgi:hypothetical protein